MVSMFPTDLIEFVCIKHLFSLFILYFIYYQEISLVILDLQERFGLIIMEEVVGDNASPLTALANWRNDFSKAFQYYLDRSVPHITRRWLGTLAAAAVYFMRVFYVQGFYVVSYGLGIYILNLLIGFMSPKVDPELEALDGTSLPTKDSDEFRPFIRRLPEFKFW